jgi:hypothetical protein
MRFYVLVVILLRQLVNYSWVTDGVNKYRVRLSMLSKKNSDSSSQLDERLNNIGTKTAPC